ncbi:hypothetical protein ABZU75_32975 [Streptosporangium sp. NPDC005286]|uniref:hypothetical protein n=1 Tax=Streptosporangium sp. NPDC005286 TaxID=3154463 RepID=UPI0033B9C3DC
MTVLAAHLPLIGLLITARPLIQNGHLSAGGVVGAVTYLVTGLDPALRSLVGIVGGWGVTLAVTLRRLAETIAPHPRRPRPPSALRPPRPISRPPPAPSRSAISCVCGA